MCKTNVKCKLTQVCLYSLVQFSRTIKNLRFANDIGLLTQLLRHAQGPFGLSHQCQLKVWARDKC